MDFDWLDAPFELKRITPKEIEESFEDPFSLRFLPDAVSESAKARYFCLGKSVGGRGIFSAFWTDGKRYRVISSREMATEEQSFYDRKNAEFAI